MIVFHIKYEYLLDFAQFGVILFVEMSFTVFLTKIFKNSVKTRYQLSVKIFDFFYRCVLSSVLDHNDSRLCLCHLRCYFCPLTFCFSKEYQYLG